MFEEFGIYDFCEELTEEQLLLVNGGAASCGGGSAARLSGTVSSCGGGISAVTTAGIGNAEPAPSSSRNSVEPPSKETENAISIITEKNKETDSANNIPVNAQDNTKEDSDFVTTHKKNNDSETNATDKNAKVSSTSGTSESVSYDGGMNSGSSVTESSHKNKEIPIMGGTGRMSTTDYLNYPKYDENSLNPCDIEKTNTESSTKLLEMHVSEQGIEFIKNYEKFRSKPYQATKNGKNTIGYGHEIQPNESFSEITEEDANILLKKDLEFFEEGIKRNYKSEKNIPLTQNQFDALISLEYNIGRSKLVTQSGILNDIGSGSPNSEIISKFLSYKYSGTEYMLGLEKRRYDELEMFLYGDYIRNNDTSLDNPFLH